MRILVDNARKYTKENDEILFAVGVQGEESFFSVQDTGIGMIEQDISHIFERFYRSDEVRNEMPFNASVLFSPFPYVLVRLSTCNNSFCVFITGYSFLSDHKVISS